MTAPTEICSCGWEFLPGTRVPWLAVRDSSCLAHGDDTPYWQRITTRCRELADEIARNDEWAARVTHAFVRGWKLDAAARPTEGDDG